MKFQGVYLFPVDLGKFKSSNMEGVGFPGGSDGKESTCNVGGLGLIPGLGRSPGEGHGNPLPYSCLENPMVRGPWRATVVHGISKSQMQLKQLCMHTYSESFCCIPKTNTILLINYSSILKITETPFHTHKKTPK